MKHIKKYNEHLLEKPTEINLSLIEDYLLRIKDKGFIISWFVENKFIKISIPFANDYSTYYHDLDKFLEYKENLDFMCSELKSFNSGLLYLYKNDIDKIVYKIELSNLTIVISFDEKVDIINPDRINNVYD